MENDNNNASNETSDIVTDSICNNNDGSKGVAEAETSSDEEKNLEVADEMMIKGSEAVKAGDLVDAVDLFSRALEIRF